MPTTLSFPVATGTLPSLQVIHMGVACRNAQLGTHEEEDDLEHTGLLTSPIVRANLHIRLELAHKPWGP